MDSFIDYINASLPDDNSKTLYKFKRHILEEMTQRANEVISRGLTDRKVVSDLIISEYPDLVADYKAFEIKDNASSKARKKLVLNVVGSLIYLVLLIIVYLGISFVTQKWAITWVLVVDGILLWVAYLLSLGIERIVRLKRIFHPFARILLAIAVMVVTVAVFLFSLAVIQFELSWILVICGIVLMFVADGLFAVITKQKLAIFSWLAYIPVIATMMFIIICSIGLVPWAIGWVIIPLSLVIDFLIIGIAIKKNFTYKGEEVDVWKES